MTPRCSLKSNSRSIQLVYFIKDAMVSFTPVSFIGEEFYRITLLENGSVSFEPREKDGMNYLVPSTNIGTIVFKS